MSYIFNKNHNRTHVPGCRAVGMMNRAKNEEIVDEPRGNSCGWCHAGSGYTRYPTRSQDNGLDPYIGEKVCHDPTLRERLKNFGCACGSHTGDVRMYPHQNGLKIPGENGPMWVYFHCFKCGHDTGFDKIPENMIRDAGGMQI